MFNYARGNAAPESEQDYDIVQALPNVNLSAGTDCVTLRIEGVHAGSVIIGINSSSMDLKK